MPYYVITILWPVGGGEMWDGGRDRYATLEEARADLDLVPKGMTYRIVQVFEEGVAPK